MSLNLTNLEILSRSGTERQKILAKRIMPIRKKGHLLLVTLLLGNTVVNESLPILFDSIFGGGLKAIVISTFLIFVFGEIIPQSLCTRYSLEIGGFFAYPLQVIQFIMFPIAYPISKLLDFLLGADRRIMYRKAELKELVALNDTSHGGDLSLDEVTIINGALGLSEKLVVDVMTDLKNTFMLSIDDILDSILLKIIINKGHSRIPIYENYRENIIGVLLVKSLVLVNPDQNLSVRDVQIHHIPWVSPEISLFDLLNAFQEGRSHMAVVSKNSEKIDLNTPNLVVTSLPKLHSNDKSVNGKKESISSHTILFTSSSDTLTRHIEPIGIVTLEDIIEELIQEEIIDETDVFIDIRNRIKVSRISVDQRNHIRSNRVSISENSQSGLLSAGLNPKEEKVSRQKIYIRRSPSTQNISFLSVKNSNAKIDIRNKPSSSLIESSDAKLNNPKSYQSFHSQK
ncbi:hypothetical protein BB561_004508 [Smittium simulii]|uniref:CNNM transmembrane domain-containing protein n=1 Tax=Smittium simulii TaxID=133385 RepID=A0A2T9YG07_9FUNG|nr:hypothetical protein BB561_004508 [Smittium simulii]